MASGNSKTTFQLLRLAWGMTGGWKKSHRSLDFWSTLGVWLLCSPYWMKFEWWEQVISVLPNLLGFTLGGFAIFLGFGSESFKTMLSDKDERKSQYVSVSAAFLIFVCFQIAALLYAFIAKSLHFNLQGFTDKYAEQLVVANSIGNGIGYWLFIYSLVCAFRAAMRIFRVSRWYHHLIVIEAIEAANNSAAELRRQRRARRARRGG